MPACISQATLPPAHPALKQLCSVAPSHHLCPQVIAATNIAETSVTLEGIVYVVDSCFAKQVGAGSGGGPCTLV